MISILGIFNHFSLGNNYMYVYYIHVYACGHIICYNYGEIYMYSVYQALYLYTETCILSKCLFYTQQFLGQTVS